MTASAGHAGDGHAPGVVAQRFPAAREVPAGELLAGVRAVPAAQRLVFGDERAVEFLAALSRRLTRPALARRHPELAPLGFFLRRSSLSRWISQAGGMSSEGVRVPRGLVFQIVPGNVETLAVYPWALSLLAGNANVVRLPSRGSALLGALVAELCAAAGEASPVIGQSQRLISYGHDDTITATLSAACQLRVMWGRDATIGALRRLPIPAAARDLPFAHRCSLAALSAPAWLDAPAATRAQVAEGFCNDAYWYGQAACASPLTLCWVGPPDLAGRAHGEFTGRLEAVLGERRPPVDAQMAVEKRVATYGLAAAGEVTAIRHASAMLATVTLAPGRLLRDWAGTGTFGVVSVPSLAGLADLVSPVHQTLSYFGFAQADLAGLARLLGGQGIDRIVPIGEALAFEPAWDGYDLLREFSKLVTIR